MKLFLCHVCDDESHRFLDWLSERLREDIQQLESFIACRDRDSTNAADLNRHLDESEFVSPIVTDEFPKSPNCVAELKRARDRKAADGVFPIIIPVRLTREGSVMEVLGFKIDQEKGTGEIWVDFSDEHTWEVPYGEFHDRLVTAALNHGILGEMNFRKDCALIDDVIAAEEPTAFYIDTALRFIRRGPEYASYFFGRLEKKGWIPHLISSGLPGLNPPPIEEARSMRPHAPFWAFLLYLERVSAQCVPSQDNDCAERLMRIIRDITRPRDGKKVDNARTWWYLATILANLPTEVIKREDIDMVRVWLGTSLGVSPVGMEIGKSLLPKLLQSPSEEDWRKAADLVGIATKVISVERVYGSGRVERELRTAVDSYSLRELFSTNAVLLGERCGREVAQILIARLGCDWGAALGDSYSYIWRPAIEDHQFNRGQNRPKNVLVSALRDVLLSYTRARPEQATQTLRGLLNQELIIVKRIALHVLNEHFGAQNDVFWEALAPRLFELHFRHEMFELLSRHFRDFSASHQNRVIEIINALKVEVPEKEETGSQNARLRLEWLEAVRRRGNERADGLYAEYLAAVRYAPDHPEFVSYIEVRAGETRPLSVETFLSFAVPEIVSYLKTFRETGAWGEPTEEGLAELLEDAVDHNPEMFEGDLNQFLEVQPLYQYSILRGFERLWEGRRLIDWSEILKFCRSIVLADTFWQQNAQPKASDGESKTGWVLSCICSLIEKGVRDDGWAFDEAHLPAAEEVIRLILEKQPASAVGREEDALGEAMNTVKGRCLMALFNYSLRQARLSDKRCGDHKAFWERIHAVFDRELQQCRGANFEFSALAGRFLPNLYYLWEAWAIANIDSLFPIAWSTNWNCAMQGYAYVSVFTPKVYKLLSEHGHLTKGLETDFKNPHVRGMLIQEISAAYLNGLESLTDTGSPFAEILRRWDAEDITGIISFFWDGRDAGLCDEATTRVLEFWRFCHDKIRGREDENVDVLADLSLLTAFLPSIDAESGDWLLQVAPYVKADYQGQFFLENLLRLVMENPKAVADVYLRVLSGTVPRYREEDVRNIVEELYKAGLKVEATAICNKYAENAAIIGYADFLKDLYNRYGR